MQQVDIRLRIAGLIVLVGAYLLLAMLTFQGQQEWRQEIGAIAEDVAALKRQIEQIQTSRSSQTADGGPAAEQSKGIGDFAERLLVVEEDVALLWQGQQNQWSGGEPSPSGQEDASSSQEDADLPPPTPVLATRFQSEGKVSDWGKRSEEGINYASGASDYIQGYGGKVDTECRESTCRVTWYLPSLDDLTADQRERLLMLGRSELAALATQGASNVGRLESSWEIDGGAPRLSLFFDRTP